MIRDLESWEIRLAEELPVKEEVDYFAHLVSLDVPRPTDWLKYGVVCMHDDGYFCEHRRDFLGKFIAEELAIRTTEVIKEVDAAWSEVSSNIEKHFFKDFQYGRLVNVKKRFGRSFAVEQKLF